MDAAKLAAKLAASPEYRAMQSAPPGTRRVVRIVDGRAVVGHEEIPLAEIAAALEAKIAAEETPAERMVRIALEAVDSVRAASKKMPPEADALLSDLRTRKAGRDARMAAIQDAKAKGDRGALLKELRK